MTVFFDTNVILDILLERQPFFEASQENVRQCMRQGHMRVVSALTFSTASYILGKAIGIEASLSAIDRFRKIVSISPVTAQSVDWAITSKSHDFEDAMQYESALSAHADVIVTRDPDGFAGSQIRVLSPSEFLKEVCS